MYFRDYFNSTMSEMKTVSDACGLFYIFFFFEGGLFLFVSHKMLMSQL